jgi:hypothetical protein
MTHVITMPKLVTWASTADDLGAKLSAILCHPEQDLQPFLYLSLLAERIQRMVNLCEDPQEARGVGSCELSIPADRPSAGL